MTTDKLLGSTFLEAKGGSKKFAFLLPFFRGGSPPSKKQVFLLGGAVGHLLWLALLAYISPTYGLAFWQVSRTVNATACQSVNLLCGGMCPIWVRACMELCSCACISDRDCACLPALSGIAKPLPCEPTFGCLWASILAVGCECVCVRRYVCIYIYICPVGMRGGPDFHIFSAARAPQFLKKRFLPQKEANEELRGSPRRLLRGSPKTGAVTEGSLAAVEISGLLRSSWNASPRRTGSLGVIFETFSIS